MHQFPTGPIRGPTARAFSSEVETGSRQENASNQESRAPFRFHRTEALERPVYAPRRIDFAGAGRHTPRETARPEAIGRSLQGECADAEPPPSHGPRG